MLSPDVSWVAALGLMTGGAGPQGLGADGFGHRLDVIEQVGRVNAVDVSQMVAHVFHDAVRRIGSGHVPARFSIFIESQGQHPVATCVLLWHLTILLGQFRSNSAAMPNIDHNARLMPIIRHSAKRDTNMRWVCP
jgi:hypothetical protein